MRDVLLPGMASRLPCKLGTQKLWMTSADASFTWMGRPTGTCISYAVVNWIPATLAGYVISHHHLWPLTSMVIASLGASDARARLVATLRKSMTVSAMHVTAVAR